MLFDVSLLGDPLVRRSGGGVENDPHAILEGDLDGPGAINDGQQVDFFLGQFKDGGFIFHEKLRQTDGFGSFDPPIYKNSSFSRMAIH